MNYRGKNKRKPYFSSNLMAKKRKDLFLKAGMKGFICTCNGNEKQCIRESYNILNEYADRLYSPEEVGSRISTPFVSSNLIQFIVISSGHEAAVEISGRK